MRSSAHDSRASTQRSVHRRDDVARAREAGEASTEAALAHVYGFQELILNRAVTCAGCGVRIGRGARAYLGMSDAPSAARTWVCQDCVDGLGE